jgi:hypothetical protein
VARNFLKTFDGGGMKKEFFTLQEAVRWLSKRGGDKFSREDLLRANEKGRAPIYFDYVGNLGIFAEYSGKGPWIFPKPTQNFYFKGVLKSLSPCNRGVTTFPMRRGPITASNVLRPHKVEVVQSEILHSDLDISTKNAVGMFWGRVRASNTYTAVKLPRSNDHIVPGRATSQIDYYLDSTSEVPESTWRFHFDDLCDLASLAPEMTPPQSEALVSNAGTPSAVGSSVALLDRASIEMMTPKSQAVPSNDPGWKLKKCDRYPGYRKPLYDVLKAAHDDGKACPTACDVLGAFNKNMPPGIVRVMAHDFEYLNSNGGAETADLNAIRKAIDRLVA